MESQYKKRTFGYLNELAKNNGFNTWSEYYIYLVDKKKERLKKKKEDKLRAKETLTRKKKERLIKEKEDKLLIGEILERNKIINRYIDRKDTSGEPLGENLSTIINVLNNKDTKHIDREINKLNRKYGSRWMDMKWNIGFMAEEMIFIKIL